MMNVKLLVNDVTAQALNFQEAIQHGLSPLYEFFQFGRYPRNFSSPSVLKDCFFAELYLTRNVEKWGANPPPPDPAVFEEFFPHILRVLTGPGNKLTLHIKSLDPDYFDELEVIKTLLVSRNLNYILLANPLVPGEPRTQLDVGNLVFEWPVDALDYVVEHWFMSPIVSCEGYISGESCLPRIAECYFQADTEERIRELLRKIEIGFKVWQDNNGLFLLSDKFGSAALQKRLEEPDLLSLLQAAPE